MKVFKRISSNPKVMGGRACVRGMRITVSVVLSLIASGMKYEEILRDYPYLELEDIHECLRYASWLTREDELLLVD